MYRLRFHAMVLSALVCALLASHAWADSHARIVRLSDVQGGVQIDKNSGHGFENAFLNLPITQGTQLRTGASGRAEIEFEDGSTLRMTPGATIEFTTLGSNDEGKRTSVVNLANGRTYVNWLGKTGDSFTLNFSREKVELTKAAHFRVAASPTSAEVASFKNDLEVVGPSGTVKVARKKMVSFNLNDDDQATVAKNLARDPYDEWDKQSVEYHQEYARNDSTPYGYGYSDLSYYGAFTSFGGYGTLWQPYFAGAGWNPFLDGAWAWYPGFGYMWASAYPWGWMPYRYGNWVYAPGFGWGWQAGGWNGWHGGINYVGAAPGFRPPVAPTGTVSTVVVGKGGPAVTNAPGAVFTIDRGLAGIGIPRGTISNLRDVNSHMIKTGSTQLHVTTQLSASSSRAGEYGYSGVHASSPSPVGHASSASSGHSSSGGSHR